jgi:hypothetical protein
MAHAGLVALLPADQHNLAITGVTGNYAVFTFTRSNSRAVHLEAIVLTGRRRGKLLDLGVISPAFDSVLAIRGLVVYRRLAGRAEVVDLADGKRTDLSGIPAGPLLWWEARLVVGRKTIAVPGAHAMSSALPPGYRWIAVDYATAPVVAVPTHYRVQELPGGSSQGVKAESTAGPLVVVTVWQNACVGCSDPGLLAQGANTLPTPVYVGRHPDVRPVGDHGYLALLPAGHGDVIYERGVYYVEGGDLDASIMVPRGDAALARTVLATLRLPN